MGTGDRRQCVAIAATSGLRCRKWAMHGATVCDTHGGRTRRARAGAARRLAEARALESLADVDVVAIGNPLEELAAVAAEARTLQRVLLNEIADMRRITGTNHLGDRVLTPEFMALERASDRVAKLLADWTRLGFDERMVGLHERQAELVADLIRTVLDDPELELTAEQRTAAPTVVGRHLAAVRDAS